MNEKTDVHILIWRAIEIKHGLNSRHLSHILPAQHEMQHCVFHEKINVFEG